MALKEMILEASFKLIEGWLEIFKKLYITYLAMF